MNGKSYLETNRHNKASEPKNKSTKTFLDDSFFINTPTLVPTDAHVDKILAELHQEHSSSSNDNSSLKTSSSPIQAKVITSANKFSSFPKNKPVTQLSTKSHRQIGSAEVHQVANEGLTGTTSPLPHLSKIQESFGKFKVDSVLSYMNKEATDANQRMGADAYASGNKVAFRTSPSLHTAAHEAAHVVQQRAGVNLNDGVGKAGDQYEQQADKVADLVVQGKSAEQCFSNFAQNQQQYEKMLNTNHYSSNNVQHVLAQIIPTSAGDTIEKLIIVGRPESPFSGTMGDHLTAFASQAEGLRNRFKGATYEQAINAVKDLSESSKTLPGIKLVADMPNGAPLKIKFNAAKETLEEATIKATDKLNSNSVYTPLAIQNLVDAYLQFRELIPFNVMNIAEISKGLAGKGKGESKRLRILREEEESEFQRNDSMVLIETVEEFMDIEGAALLATEPDDEITKKIVPGLNPDITAQERFDLAHQTHTISMLANFPISVERSNWLTQNPHDHPKHPNVKEHQEKFKAKMYRVGLNQIEHTKQIYDKKISAAIEKRDKAKQNYDTEFAEKKRITVYARESDEEYKHEKTNVEEYHKKRTKLDNTATELKALEATINGRFPPLKAVPPKIIVTCKNGKINDIQYEGNINRFEKDEWDNTLADIKSEIENETVNQAVIIARNLFSSYFDQAQMEISNNDISDATQAKMNTQKDNIEIMEKQKFTSKGPKLIADKLEWLNKYLLLLLKFKILLVLEIKEQAAPVPLAAQVKMDEITGKITQIDLEGRSPSPFSNTMGAHTTAWKVHLDGINRQLKNKDLNEAITKIKEFFGEEKDKANKIIEKPIFGLNDKQRNGMADTEQKFINIGNKLSDRNAATIVKLLWLQQYITLLLTYMNYIPGATIEAVDTRGKSEATPARILREYETGQDKSDEELLDAILQLLDIGEVKNTGHEILFKYHKEAIKRAYPQAYDKVKAELNKIAVGDLPEKIDASRTKKNKSGGKRRRKDED